MLTSNLIQLLQVSCTYTLRTAQNTPGLDLGSSLDDLLGSLVLVLVEVLNEERCELGNLLLEVRSTRPALGRVEELVGDVGASLRDLQVEGLVCLVLNLGKLSAVDGVEDSTSVLQWATLATSGSTGTGPTGVEEPCVGVVL